MQNPLESAKTELSQLLERKGEIERRIDAIQQTIKILEPVYGEQTDIHWLVAAVVADAGLTDRIRRVLQACGPESGTPTAIRDVLIQSGFNAEGRSNFLAEIHNILKRLVAQGDAEEVVRNDGGKAYRATLGSFVPRHPAYMPASSDPITTPLRKASELLPPPSGVQPRGKVTLRYPSGEKKK